MRSDHLGSDCVMLRACLFSQPTCARASKVTRVSSALAVSVQLRPAPQSPATYRRPCVLSLLLLVSPPLGSLWTFLVLATPRRTLLLRVFVFSHHCRLPGNTYILRSYQMALDCEREVDWTQRTPLFRRLALQCNGSPLECELSRRRLLL